ncbi:MAG TPA: hypothetical protein VFR01_03255 [Geobacterales bacterium]|nr:hypothetical protein [Geobacterales bacterium]
MDFMSIGIGVAGVLYGIYAAVARVRTPEKFWKLEPMKKFWGERAGLAIHFLGYTVVPIVIGVLFILRGVGR